MLRIISIISLLIISFSTNARSEHLPLAKKVYFQSSEARSSYFTGKSNDLQNVLTWTFKNPVDYKDAIGVDNATFAKHTFIHSCLLRVFRKYYNDVCKVPQINKETLKRVKYGNTFFQVKLIDNPKEKNTCASFNAFWLDLVEVDGKLIKFVVTNGYAF